MWRPIPISINELATNPQGVEVPDLNGAQALWWPRHPGAGDVEVWTRAPQKLGSADTDSGVVATNGTTAPLLGGWTPAGRLAPGGMMRLSDATERVWVRPAFNGRRLNGAGTALLPNLVRRREVTVASPFPGLNVAFSTQTSDVMAQACGRFGQLALMAGSVEDWVNDQAEQAGSLILPAAVNAAGSAVAECQSVSANARVGIAAPEAVVLLAALQRFSRVRLVLRIRTIDFAGGGNDFSGDLADLATVILMPPAHARGGAWSTASAPEGVMMWSQGCNAYQSGSPWVEAWATSITDVGTPSEACGHLVSNESRALYLGETLMGCVYTGTLQGSADENYDVCASWVFDNGQSEYGRQRGRAWMVGGALTIGAGSFICAAVPGNDGGGGRGALAFRSTVAPSAVSRSAMRVVTPGAAPILMSTAIAAATTVLSDFAIGAQPAVGVQLTGAGATSLQAFDLQAG